MIFLTVGSSRPFDRLVQLVDDAVADSVIDEVVFAQIGRGRYVPRAIEFVRFLQKQRYNEYFDSASAIISHAGIGTISYALRQNKPILVMPRRKGMRELVDDHQVLTAQKFATLGHVLEFSDRRGLVKAIENRDHFSPVARKPNVDGITLAIGNYLTGLIGSTSDKM